ncbi:MAG: amidohydrolase [Desulfosporosinus sp.]|nr:amidohydrolase [Desulfosporosinus sp.]
MMDIKKEISLLEEELVSLRRDFHRNPELGYQEYRTSEIITNNLTQCGFDVKQVCKTGVVGLLNGKEPGRTLLLRADMDALPQEELNELSYKSVHQGKMHACGHDGHMAMLLVAAKLLARHKDEFKGTLKVVFQPNEEEAGALDMVKAGVLEDPKVDAALALHLWTPLESGKIGLAAGPVMAANEEFELTVFGNAGHTATPQTAIDPLVSVATIIQAVQSIQTREVNVLDPTLIMFGKIKGGTGRNIVADQVQLGGTLRFLYKNEEKEKAELKERFERVISGICSAMRTKYKLEYIPSNPALMNDPAMTELARKSAREVLGGDGQIVSYSCMAGEDFAEFSCRVPSVFCFIGTGNSQKETDFPHHHPQFNLDEDTLVTGVEMHVRTALSYLNKM